MAFLSMRSSFNSIKVRLKAAKNHRHTTYRSGGCNSRLRGKTTKKLSMRNTMILPDLRQTTYLFDFQYVKERITAIARFFFREYTSTDNRLQEVIDTTPLFTKDLLIQPFFLST